MGAKTGIDTVPTDYQAGLLLAALDDEHHRIPGDAKGRTLDLFYARQWVREYTATGKLASTVRDYPGFTHFRLTHHGVNAAKKARAARTAAAERGPQTMNVEGIGWTCVKAGRKWATEYEGVKFELERRTRNVADGCPNTGWYLYGGSHFGEYMSARFKAAAVAAFPYVCPKEGHPRAAATTTPDAVPTAEAYPANPAGLAAAERDLYAARKRLRAQPGLTEHTALTQRCAQLRYRMTEIRAALAEQFPVDTAAVYVPDPTEEYRDVVIVESGPDKDGKVAALSARHKKTIRVALDKLQPLPELPPLPAGEHTDWWAVTDKSGTEVARVQADGYDTAREAAEKVPAAREASIRDGGLSYRRLMSSEL
jgi:hypothetical protein